MKNNLRVLPRRIVGDFLSTPENTNTVARTTDAFISVQRDTRKADDAKMLEGLVGATIKVGAQVQKDNAEEDAIKGKSDALAGKEMETPSGFLRSTKAYTEAYQGVKDEAQGIRFRDEYLSILRENDYFINTTDPEAQQQDIYKKLYENYFGGGYLTKHGRDGLLTDRGLARIEEALLVGNSEFSKRGIEFKKEGFLNDTYTLMSDVVDTMLEAKSISPDVLSATLDSNYEDYVANNGNIITKAEYQGIMIDKFSQKAKEKARLGDIDGALGTLEMIKNLRDKEGNLYDRITNNDPKTGKLEYAFRNTIDGIEKDVHSEINAVKKVQEEAKAQAKENTYAQYIVGISDLFDENSTVSERHIKVAHLRDKLQEDLLKENIDPTKGKTLLNKLDDMYNKKGKINSHSQALREAIAYVNRPNADYNTFVETYGDYLSDTDFVTFTNKLFSNQKVYRNEFDEATKKVYEKFRGDLKDGKAKALNPNTIFNRFDLDGEDRVTIFNTTFEATYYNFMKENGRTPNMLELTEMANKAEEVALEQYPMKGRRRNGNSKSDNDPSKEETGTGEGTGEDTPDFTKLDRK